MLRQFRFGVIAEKVLGRRELTRTAQAAEAGGFSTLLIRDHFLAEPFGQQLAPLSSLSYVAAITGTLRVGSMVMANDYRSPVLLAKEAATIDVLSDGRFELGLGTGFLQAEYRQAGIPFESPAVRVGRFAEAVQIYKALLSGEPVTFSGQHYRLEGVQNFPQPVQRPRPPILVGAGGKRMLGIAAREADSIGLLSAAIKDGVLVEDPTSRLADEVEKRLHWIREAAGSRLPEIELGMFMTLLPREDRLTAAEDLIRQRGWRGVTPDQVLDMPSVFIGSAARTAELMQERRETYGITYYVVGPAAQGEVAQLIACL
ncbi:MAG: TIGR03621 family F420-dependent LLM class oxidoreductase [Candidatus Dormibacteraeota bacterium]|nr:TIGR03621 family F420-dependent LLM class oxidoreductase [Candidatus Dormibacteraeota bacterium]